MTLAPPPPARTLPRPVRLDHFDPPRLDTSPALQLARIRSQARDFRTCTQTALTLQIARHLPRVTEAVARRRIARKAARQGLPPFVTPAGDSGRQRR